MFHWKKKLKNRKIKLKLIIKLKQLKLRLKKNNKKLIGYKIP